MKYIAQFCYCGQVSPDDWETITETLEVTEETTIGEIKQWIRDKRQGKEEHHTFTIRTVDQLKPKN